MRSVRTVFAVIGLCALTAGLGATLTVLPASAGALSPRHAIPVACDEWSLLAAIDAAEATGGDILLPALDGTYTDCAPSDRMPGCTA